MTFGSMNERQIQTQHPSSILKAGSLTSINKVIVIKTSEGGNTEEGHQKTLLPFEQQSSPKYGGQDGITEVTR